jgi:nucleophosmin 3
MTEDYFWGLTLDKDKTSDIWDPDVKGDANDSAQGYRGEHTLLVKQAVLGPEAKDDEINVVEVEAMGYKSDVKYPITVLRGGSQHQSLLDLLFPDPPVTFKLIKGSGPVHLLGNHSVGSGDGIGEDDEDEMEDEFDEEEDIEEAPEKNSVGDKKRKIAQSNSNAKQNKRSKGNTDEDD